ncbi:MAG: hypothetical protein RIB57_13585 [Pelagibacterium sp.]|uniref:hypothetical protein n=1 Tax=Pelagibacterium sp. TaxID=1967288 RepID=UPI0032EEDD52
MSIIASVDDLCRVAASGGGLDLRGKTLSVDDLCRIASSASKNGARIVVSPKFKTINDLCKIGAAGKGSVMFQD